MKWTDLKFFNSDLFKDIKLNLQGQSYLPEAPDVFRAFAVTPFEDVKVVILGQDPYPTPGHAHGLAFSVKSDVKPFPRSLQNIFKELVEDQGCPYPETGNLSKWANQGVLLLNTSLTVEPRKIGSHMGMGWQNLTMEVMLELAAQKPNVVYIFWGNKAKEYIECLPRGYKCVIRSAHPSPMSANRGFFGSKPFSRANEMLVNSGQEPIDWSL